MYNRSPSKRTLYLVIAPSVSISYQLFPLLLLTSLKTKENVSKSAVYADLAFQN